MNVIKIPNIVTLELSVEEINILSLALHYQVAQFRERKLTKGEVFVNMCQLESQFEKIAKEYRFRRCSLFDVTEGE